MAEREQLKCFGAYVKALDLFHQVVGDLSPLADQPLLQRLIAQQFASADSVAANIEQGYGRGTQQECAQFLIVARGFAQETGGRYGRFSHWLPADVVAQRVALCEEIVGILTASIPTPGAKGTALPTRPV